MVKLSTIAAIATVTLLRASLKSLRLDPANPPEGTRERDADIRDMRDREAEQHDLMTMIEYFTATPSEDREMLLAICEQASATEASAEEATEALRRVFMYYRDAPQQLSATTLWAQLLLYSPELFLPQCAKTKFLDTLEDILNSPFTLCVVRERLLDVLAGAVEASSRTSYQGVSGYGVLWRKVKSTGKPDEGVLFCHDDAMNNLLSRRNTENISNAMRLQRGSGEEDHTLSAQRTVLVECCICTDEMPVGSCVHIDSCGHTFCRKCLHGHVAARLDELSFPIHCPTCTAAKGKGKGKASAISQSTGLNLGLAEGYPPSMKQSLHPTTPSDTDSTLYAMRLQRAFDDEDRALSTQRAELVNFAQRLFKCSICMDDVPMDSIARIDSCGHSFCRECLRGHVAACLGEHRFPVRCPTCTANKGKGKGKEQTGEVSQLLALDLGLTDEQLNIWTEMEMAAFSILLQCRKYARGVHPLTCADCRNRCQRSMFVARDEHDSVSVIACPLPDCDHIWCIQCQQSIDLKGPRHSCDGTSELDNLVKEQGWKYCPTCKTPIQKTSGCNHMTCITPACNTHFCYLCGNLIVKTASSREIEQATSSHYRGTCRLFEVPE